MNYELRMNFTINTISNDTLVESKPLEFLSQYTPCVIAIVIIFIYSLAVRLAYSWDYKTMHQGDLVVLENQSKEISLTKGHLYLIFIDTGFWMNAGTNAHVRLEIHAKNFCSRVYCLRASSDEKEILQRGKRDIFVLNTSDCLGDILSLTLLVMSPGEEANWFLERIKIMDVSHNRKWLFPYHHWLSNNNRPNFVLKLFPLAANIPDMKLLLQSRHMEMNTWTSIFISYNRLGRLCRIERITICASNLMAMIFAYVALVQFDYWYMFDENDFWQVVLFILLCWTAFFLGIVSNYLPEMILRNSVPILWPFEALDFNLNEPGCAECNKRNTADSAVLTNEICPEYYGSCFNSTTHCKICCLDNTINEAEGENEGKFDGEQCKFSKTPKELIGDMLCSERKKQSRDPNLITKYYDLASKYVRFFDTWSGFCDKFCDVVDELRAYMDSYRECELIKHRKCLIWLLGGMEETQEQFCLVKRCFKSNSTSATLPDNILFPENKCQLIDGAQQTIRLLRLTVFLMLTTVIDWLDCIKNIQMNALPNGVPRELRAQLHHLVFNLFYALDAFVLERNQLYQVCNKMLCKQLKTVDMFISIYLGDSGQCDFELVRIGDNERVLSTEVDVKHRGPNCGSSWDPLHDIRTHIFDHTNNVVTEAICGVVQVCRCRRPLSVFADYMKYRTEQNDPLEWAAICVDFTLPLISVLSKSLIFHVKRFTGQRSESGFMCVQIQQYIQTVITNAALQALRRVKCECKSRMRDPFQAMSRAEMCLPHSDDACSDYAIAVNLFRHCLESNEIVNQVPDKCCPEGKVHIQDTNVLKLLLEEGKLKPNQLACGQMVDAMEKLVGSYYEKLVAIEKFVSRAALTLTDSQEILFPPNGSCSTCTDESAEFILKIRAQIQQMSFILVKLLHRSKEQTPRIPRSKPLPNTPLYWTSKGYVDQPFIQTVESFKHEIACDIHPLTKPEILKIQAIAFNIHKMSLSIYWTIATYLYILFQNILFLALIVKWAERMSKLVGLASIPYMIIALFLEVLLAQPLRMVITAYLLTKYLQIKNEKSQNSRNVREKSQNSSDVRETSQYSSRFRETTQNSSGTGGTSQYSSGFRETSQNSSGTRGTSQNTSGARGTSQNSSGTGETSQNLSGARGTSQNTSEAHGTSQNTSGAHGASQNSSGVLGSSKSLSAVCQTSSGVGQTSKNSS